MNGQEALQRNLAALGHDPGPFDGVVGGRTYTALVEYASGRRVEPSLGASLAREFPKVEIDTPLRACHFLAQALHETDGFRYLTELGGPSYFAKYDGRLDLGNVEPGDGALFCGRGIFQLTGRGNYRRYGKRCGLDLITDPQLAAQPEVAARLACAYWSDHHLNTWADLDDLQEITRRVNGGLNGLAGRALYLTKLKTPWGL